MSKIILQFLPNDAAISGGAPGTSTNAGTDFALESVDFDDTTDEFAYYQFLTTNYIGGSLVFKIYWYADTASSGSVVWQVRVGSVTANIDSQDVETKPLGTTRYVQTAHLGTTGQRLHVSTIEFPNDINLMQNDVVFFFIGRDADSTFATDDMTGDVKMVAVTVEYLAEAA